MTSMAAAPVNRGTAIDGGGQSMLLSTTMEPSTVVSTRYKGHR